jgi:hypothetical protein
MIPIDSSTPKTFGQTLQRMDTYNVWLTFQPMFFWPCHTHTHTHTNKQTNYFFSYHPPYSRGNKQTNYFILYDPPFSRGNRSTKKISLTKPKGTFERHLKMKTNEKRNRYMFDVLAIYMISRKKETKQTYIVILTIKNIPSDDHFLSVRIWSVPSINLSNQRLVVRRRPSRAPLTASCLDRIFLIWWIISNE